MCLFQLKLILSLFPSFSRRRYKQTTHLARPWLHTYKTYAFKFKYRPQNKQDSVLQIFDDVELVHQIESQLIRPEVGLANNMGKQNKQANKGPESRDSVSRSHLHEVRCCLLCYFCFWVLFIILFSSFLTLPLILYVAIIFNVFWIWSRLGQYHHATLEDGSATR
jgi:hypothetical protein